jgi:hypothetical protein
MKRNLGTTDRAVRIAVGLALVGLFFVLEGSARWWGLLGLVPLATGLGGWCLLYLPLGIDTRRTARHDGRDAAQSST